MSDSRVASDPSVADYRDTSPASPGRSVKAKSILFSAPMIHALLAGTKTQTRRMIKLPTKGQYINPKMGGWAPSTIGGGGSFTLGRDGSRHPAPEKVCIWHQTTGTTIVTRWQKGDRLWVKETITLHHGFGFPLGEGPQFVDGNPQRIWSYTADGVDQANATRNRSAIHMPRWASRLTLTVTDVRVQRLQEIDDADCIAEGVRKMRDDSGMWVGREGPDKFVTPWPTAREAYEDLWEWINGPGSWDANPWVVALTFTVERRNIDA